VSSLRDTLIKSQINVEEQIQYSVSMSQDNVKQLKSTISSLRYKLEQKDTQRIGDLQKAEVLKLNEQKYLHKTIHILRKSLEEQHG
jgi:predicted nuclease with TOPRIM domain